MTRQQRRAVERATLKGRNPQWSAFVQVEADLTDVMRRADHVAAHLGVSVAEARAEAEAQWGDRAHYRNAIYVVTVKPADAEGWTHLTVRRRDGSPNIPWSDLQRIKDELIGEESEAVELYPAQSRLLDLEHRRHLWARAGERIEVGFDPGQRWARAS